MTERMQLALPDQYLLTAIHGIEIQDILGIFTKNIKNITQFVKAHATSAKKDKHKFIIAAENYVAQMHSFEKLIAQSCSYSDCLSLIRVLGSAKKLKTSYSGLKFLLSLLPSRKLSLTSVTVCAAGNRSSLIINIREFTLNNNVITSSEGALFTAPSSLIIHYNI